MSTSIGNDELAALKAELEALRRRHPDTARTTVPAAAAAHACPLCGGTMSPGRAQIRGTFWGFLFVGFSQQHLWFRRAGDHLRSEKVVVASGESTDAWQCDKCAATLVRPNASLFFSP